MFVKPKIGFLLGKFLPPHNGHKFLCEFARQYCDHLVILVATLPSEPIPGRLRYEWMKEMFPDCTVVWTNEVLPQEPKNDRDGQFWETWKQEIAKAMRAHARTFNDGMGIGGLPWKWPDVVFASEDYGHKLAASVGARFVPCDIVRQAVPISGTRVRANPELEWEFLPDVVRPYFVKRAVVFGPESTGKSTLAAELAAHFKTTLVPEYGRTYTEAFGSDVGPEDLKNIVAGHVASVAAAKRQCKTRVLIEDTDPVMTAVWSDMLVGERDPWFSEYRDHADIYLLCDVDIPWVNDGTRYFENDEDRRRFFAICEKELQDRRVPYVVIRGDRKERLRLAIDAVQGLYGAPII
jgi:HTH-type transcriptional repressor of NAD biosynthesis genes